MYSRNHHNLVAKILDSLNKPFLKENKCYFGGGTAIALLLSEYRESIDVDFLCSSKEGYRNIRSAVTLNGLHSLFSSKVDTLRDARVDRYGIRAVVRVDGNPIKFEIVSEGRISLDDDGLSLGGVQALSKTDLFAEKLLANSDRWADRQVFSRDIIDIHAMKNAWGAIPHAAKEKAFSAYGQNDIDNAIIKAEELLESNPDYARRCAKSLDIQPGDAKKIIPGYSKSPGNGYL